MRSDLQRVEEEVDEEAAHRTLTSGWRVRLPTELVAEYDLKNTVIDAVVSSEDTSVAVTDAEVDSQGRFVVGAKKCKMYGLDPGDTVTVLVDRVVLR